MHAKLIGATALVLLGLEAASAASTRGPRSLSHGEELSLAKRGSKPLGAKCKKTTSCSQGLYCTKHNFCGAQTIDGSRCSQNDGCVNGVCYNKTCLGTTKRPLTAPCRSSTQCKSAYCGHGQCAKPKAQGSCYKNAGCLSGTCVNGKCKHYTGPTNTATTSATATATSTATTTPTPTAVADSSAFTSNGPLSLGSGTVKTAGDVTVGTDATKQFEGQPYIQFVVTPGNPAVISQTLNTPVQKRQTTTASQVIFGFAYDVDSFTGDGTCTLTPSVNGHTIDTLAYTAVTSGYVSKSYTVTGPVSSFTVTVSCADQASSTVLLSNVSASSAGSTATGSATTITVPTSGSTTTVSVSLATSPTVTGTRSDSDVTMTTTSTASDSDVTMTTTTTTSASKPTATYDPIPFVWTLQDTDFENRTYTGWATSGRAGVTRDSYPYAGQGSVDMYGTSGTSTLMQVLSKKYSTASSTTSSTSVQKREDTATLGYDFTYAYWAVVRTVDLTDIDESTYTTANTTCKMGVYVGDQYIDSVTLAASTGNYVRYNNSGIAISPSIERPQAGISMSCGNLVTPGLIYVDEVHLVQTGSGFVFPTIDQEY